MLSAIVLIVISSVIGSVIGADPPGGYYTTRYDHLDIENILNQKRLVVYYAACLLDKGPCPPQGTEFKNILPEAIKNNCLRCTEKQRVVTTHAIRRLKKEYPNIWAPLEKKWDPSGENVKRLLASVNRPKPVSSTQISLLFDRFGDDNLQQEENKFAELTEDTTTTSITPTAETTSTTSTTTTSTTTTTTPRTTTFIEFAKPITVRPFNSIGPNLIVLNPKVLIDKVIYTADVVLNTVSGVLKG